MQASGRAMAGGEDRGDGEPESVVTVRVQYLEDTDPFSCANLPEPRRAPTCCLDAALPLGAQIPTLHRLLGAPLKVRGPEKGWGRSKVQDRRLKPLGGAPRGEAGAGVFLRERLRLRPQGSCCLAGGGCLLS